MKTREVSFKLLPVDAFSIDMVKKAVGLSEASAARFIYQLGVEYLYVNKIKLQDFERYFKLFTDKSLVKQGEHIHGVSDWAMDSADQVKEVYPLPIGT